MRNLRSRGLGALLVLISAGAAFGQTDLGGQRVATSSGTFLKIGLDARAAGLAGASSAIAAGPAALFYNPAGIVEDDHTASLAMSYVRWPADIGIGAVAVSRDLPLLGSRLGLGVSYLSTTFDETTEFHPLGTGRTVGYSDLAASLAFARHFTDRLAIGVSLKYLREDSGSNLDGPTSNGLLIDAGTIYEIGYRDARLAITLSNFGPDIGPSGRFESHVVHTKVDYAVFSPPTQFQLGFAIAPWARNRQRLSVTGVVLHQSDNAETFRGGLEYALDERIFFRTGYDWSADEMGFAAGAGWKLTLADRAGSIDYAFTEGGHLESVHRVGVGLGL